MFISLRPLLLAAATPLLFTMFAITGPATDSAAPKAKAPTSVKPGKKAKLQVKRFPRRSRVALFLQPTKYRGGNGFGVSVKKRFRLPKRGRGAIRFRMPKRYFACSGASDCNPKKWRKRSRVDITVCTVNKRVPKCAIAVTRIR